MINQRSQGPLRGQHFRQANLTQIGTKIIDQKSESIYVDSEVSLKKRKSKSPLEVTRGLYKSQTYKEICPQDSFKEPDRFDSPLDQSLNQPLKITFKVSGAVLRFNAHQVIRIFIQKLLYYLRVQRQHQSKMKCFEKIIEDKGSNTQIEEQEIKKSYNWSLLKKDSYEKMLLNLILIMILLAYCVVAPIFNMRFEPILIFIFIYSSYKVVDYKQWNTLDILIIGINVGSLFNKVFLFMNIINMIKVYQIMQSLNVLTSKKLLRFINSILIVVIHLNNSVHFWQFQLENEQTYDILLGQQIQLFFNLELQTHEDQNIYYVSLNRIMSLLILLYFTQQFFTYMKISDEMIKKEEFFELLLSKNTMNKQPFRNQHQVRQLLWSEVENQKYQESYLSQIDFNLPKELRKSLNIHSYLDIIQKSKFIKQKFTESFQKNLSEFVKEQTIEEGEIIQQQNQRVNKLIFIMEGEVTLQINQKRVQVLKKLNIVNQYEFFACLSSPCEITTQQRCKILIIDYESFNDLISMHEEDFQKYKMWLDKMQVQQRRCVYKICYICMDNHVTSMCTGVSYQPNYMKIISNSTYAQPSSRIKFRRFERKRTSSLVQQNLVSITALNWAQQFNLISKNTELIDQFLGKQEGDDEFQLFANDDDHTSKHQTQTYTHQQSVRSPKTNKTGITGRERERVYTDSNINRTLTIRTLKASENNTSRLKQNNNNDSIVISNSPSPIQQQNKTTLMLFTKEQIKRQSNMGSSFTIERALDKKSSIHSQKQLPQSTSILQSKEVIQQLQSNIGSPHMYTTSVRMNQNDVSLNLRRSDSQPILSELIASARQLILIKEFENMQIFEWYFPNHNFNKVIERFQNYLSKQFNNR
ncbi:unnamed protein product [Paramecium octaurelia]|uniref:Cyclic nucleotide-binding domain-containing protein n=1 Tax=Paramecium octaurelia TaxID=43137 RepID=A0A8S1TZL0_PAROT|nr:unnamed protein product [Paramecium octaurelia]